MGIDYTLSIRRKSDNKEIAKFICNKLKIVFDTEYSTYIHCYNRISADKCKFDINDLDALERAVQDNIRSLFSKIHEKKLHGILATNVEIKEQIDEELYQLENETLQELFDVHCAVSAIHGSIVTLVEDNMKCLKDYDLVKDDEIDNYNIPAYIYNVEDLKKNDKEYLTIWSESIYCVVEAT